MYRSRSKRWAHSRALREMFKLAAIIKGNHVDVMEMDAASRTGVDDIREIIESIYYKASSGRFKYT